MIKFYRKTMPAAAANIKAAKQALLLADDSFPLEAWRISDGGELTSEIILYSTLEIEERNLTFDVGGSFPGKVAVGDDSGGRLLVVPRDGSRSFYLVDSGSPKLDGAEFYRSLEDLLAGNNEVANEDLGRILSTGNKSLTIRDVFGIKKSLGLNGSVSELRTALSTRGAVLLADVKEVKYQSALQAYFEFIEFK